jgi:hypothetical protein
VRPDSLLTDAPPSLMPWVESALPPSSHPSAIPLHGVPPAPLYSLLWHSCPAPLQILCCRSHAQRPPPRSTEEKWVHDAYSGPGAQRGRARDGGGLSTTSVAGTGAGFTGVSPRIEVTGLHYEVTTADLKVGPARPRRPGLGGSVRSFSHLARRLVCSVLERGVGHIPLPGGGDSETLRTDTTNWEEAEIGSLREQIEEPGAGAKANPTCRQSSPRREPSFRALPSV